MGIWLGHLGKSKYSNIISKFIFIILLKFGYIARVRVSDLSLSSIIAVFEQLGIMSITVPYHN
jgi:hypothetical protein